MIDADTVRKLMLKMNGNTDTGQRDRYREGNRKQRTVRTWPRGGAGRLRTSQDAQFQKASHSDAAKSVGKPEFQSEFGDGHAG
jgi:hypothetical protein